jgi:hypothetical protein
MDVIAFHRLMQDKYAEREVRHNRVLWMRNLCIAALAAFWLSFALGYLLYAWK